MQKITVRFSEKIVEAMEERQEKKGLDSVAECVRELVEIGLEVEAGKLLSATKPPSSVKEAKEMALIKKLLVNNLNWSLEARLLSRYLVANTPNQPKEINLDILEKLKGKSQNFVKKLLKGESTE